MIISFGEAISNAAEAATEADNLRASDLASQCLEPNRGGDQPARSSRRVQVMRDENWRPSDMLCPVCGAPTKECNWWDDELENGGAIIGTLRRCTKCDWSRND